MTRDGVGGDARRRTALAVGVALAALGALALALVAGLATLLLARGEDGAATPAPSALVVGRPAPEIAVRTAEGATLSLIELRGRPVWLNYWAAWCGPCRAEMPALLAVSRELGRGDARLVAIATGEPERTPRDYLRREGLETLPVAFDPEGSAGMRHGIVVLPTHVFIDAEGIVRAVHLRQLGADEMRRELRSLE